MKIRPIGGKKGAGSGGAAMWVIAIAAVVIAGIVAIATFMPKQFSVSGDKVEVAAGLQNADQTNLGETATVTFNLIDRESPTLALLGTADVLAVNQNKALVAKGAASSSTISTGVNVGDTLAMQTNESTAYCDSTGKTFAITSAQPVFDVDCHTAAAESSMQTLVFDSNNVALTAHGNLSVADYVLALGAAEEKDVYLELQNRDTDSLSRVGALCTFIGTNTSGTDYFKVTDGNWKEVTVPKEMKDTSITIAGDDGKAAITQAGYENCYVPSAGGYIDLAEYKKFASKVQTLVKSGATNPTAGGGNFIGAIFVDYGCNVVGTEIVCSYARPDENQKTTEVGIAETLNSPLGKQLGFIAELT